jgi:Tol biopolymer transport system component
MRSRLIRSALATAAFGLAAAPAAHATLVYDKLSGKKPSVWVANDDGTGAHRFASDAELPQISSDGQTIVYVADAAAAHSRLVEVPAAGGTPQTIVNRWTYGTTAFSPDDHWVVATAGGTTGKERLKLIDVATGDSRTIARGYFTQESFSPDSTQVVYSLANKQDTIFPKVDLWIAPVAGGAPQQLTSDGHSLSPLWGPASIAYSRYKRPTGKHRKEDGPKYNLYLIDPATRARSQLTHDKVPFLLTGLTPTAWSQDGAELVSVFGGQDTVYGVTVDPATGTERRVGKRSQSFVPTALSTDGSTILGYNGVEGGPGGILTTPYAGGTFTTLAKTGTDPDWTR